LILRTFVAHLEAFSRPLAALRQRRSKIDEEGRCGLFVRQRITSAKGFCMREYSP
jgi:hypothetical protein